MKVLDYKQPSEHFEQEVRFDNLLADSEYITWAGATAHVAKGTASDASQVVESVAASASTALVVLRRGTDGVSYGIRVLASTSGGNVWEEDLVLRVSEGVP